MKYRIIPESGKPKWWLLQSKAGFFSPWRNISPTQVWGRQDKQELRDIAKRLEAKRLAEVRHQKTPPEIVELDNMEPEE